MAARPTLSVVSRPRDRARARCGPAFLLPLLVCLGCTTFRSEQVDESTPASKSEPTRRISTTLRGTAWFSSSQALTKMKALQTDKTQSIGADTIGQQGATNTVAALQSLERILEIIRPGP